MFGVLLIDIFFFAIPIILITLLSVSIYRYASAKKQNKAIPGTFPDSEIKKRKIVLIVLSVITGVLVGIVVGFMVLISIALSFM